MASVIDFHTHVLPNIDDGSNSPQESLEMLQAEAAQGISQVIATPHFYAHNQKLYRFLEKRAKAQELLQEVMKGIDGLPTLRVGAEIYYFDGISDSESLADLIIEGTNCVLIEMPLGIWHERYFEELESIYTNRNLIPIIAHIDRYIAPFHIHQIPERLAQLPVLVQANATFFTQRNTRRLALKLLEQNMIHLLGSDCHNLMFRPPMLEDALKLIRRKLGQEAIDQIIKNQQVALGERPLDIQV